MAWSYRKNARHRNPKKDVRKAVCNKTKRKTKNEMAGWRVHGPEKDGNKRMERQSKESRGLEAYCKGGQGPPWAVVPLKKKNSTNYYSIFMSDIPKCYDNIMYKIQTNIYLAYHNYFSSNNPSVQSVSKFCHRRNQIPALTATSISSLPPNGGRWEDCINVLGLCWEMLIQWKIWPTLML